MNTQQIQAVAELISAMSSLNMYPKQIDGAEGYLSETDANAKHAMEHIQAALRLLNGSM